MSLFNALTTAVGGLTAQSRQIGNISDNLANTQTVGFKRIETRFESLVTQSNSRINDPGGVVATPSYQNSEQGTLLQSAANTSLAISGNGFFPVRQPEIGTNGLPTFGTEDLFTRRGDFELNSDGYMVNGAGYYLIGYDVDPTTLAVDTSQTTPILISQLLDNPVPTNTVTYAANLPSNAAIPTTYPASTIQIFDALGNSHPVNYIWTKTAVNTWSLNVTAPTAVPAFTDSLVFTFNAVTNIGTIATLANDGTAPASFTIVPPVAPDNEAIAQISLAFPGAGTQVVSLDFGGYNQSGGVTQFADTDLQVTSLEQNGIPRGSFRDLAIDESGFINLNFDNGRTRTFFQIPVVQFFAPSQLRRVDGGAYQRTVDSGTPRFAQAGNVGAGTIISNTLENSNVDIADEFTKMIQSQRIYSANARVVTTANNMLDEIVNATR